MPRRLRANLELGSVVATWLLVAACSSDIGGNPMDQNPVASGSTPTGTSPLPGDMTNPTGQVPNDGSVTPGDPTGMMGGPQDPANPAVPQPGVTTDPNAPLTPPETEPTPAVPAAFEPAPGMLRRLTRTQFRNAVQDVFGVEVDVSQLDSDNWTGDFASIGAATVVTSARGVEQYHTAIESAVDQVFANPATREEFLGCTPTADAQDACLRGFIERMGERAWRRPLEAAELERVMGVAQTVTAAFEDPLEGARWATVTLFSSPHFLYRPELGVETASGLRFSGYEMASRLAFLVWGSLPDETLLQQAADGTLDTKDGLRAATERLLDAPRGREAVGAFAEEYMRLDRVLTQAKDSELFPEYGPSLQAAMVRDMRETWQANAFDDNASALDLFTTDRVVVNAELAALYGVDASGLDSETFREATLPADLPRVGILGKAAFLSQFANQAEGSPTLRGKFMRSAFMCVTVPPPADASDAVFEEVPSDMPMTKRDKLEKHREDPVCAGCHALMDPLGLPFENFDAIGRFRTTEVGLPIDPSSEFEGTAVADARELAAVIADSEAVAECMVRKFYSYALGFEERRADKAVIEDLVASFQGSGFKLRQLVLDIATHDAFSAVAPQPETEVTTQ